MDRIGERLESPVRADSRTFDRRERVRADMPRRAVRITQLRKYYEPVINFRIKAPSFEECEFEPQKVRDRPAIAAKRFNEFGMGYDACECVEFIFFNPVCSFLC